MNAIKITSAITALANAISSKLTANEISLLASILEELSDTLNTIATIEGISNESAEQRQNGGE